jgi:hypothetical protein
MPPSAAMLPDRPRLAAVPFAASPLAAEYDLLC